MTSPKTTIPQPDYIQLDGLESESEPDDEPPILLKKPENHVAPPLSPEPQPNTTSSFIDTRWGISRHSLALDKREEVIIEEDFEPGSVRGLLVQAQVPLLISVVGLIMAGSLLDIIQHWDVFVQVTELFILVPVLLNLKGNLEMNLASRLSTAANVGQLDRGKSRRLLVLGNLELLVTQALIVGCIAGLFSFVLGLISHPHDKASFYEFMLMLTSSMVCAALSSFVLGTFMCGLVILSRMLRINPDNIASPLASSLGDLVALLILAGFSQLMMQSLNTFLCTGIFIVLVFFVPILAWLVYRNKYVRNLLTVGWTPILVAMAISSMAGLVLERFVAEYMGLALLAPVLNGITGNLGSIYASRISTCLHAGKQEHYSRVEWTLFLMNLPIQATFLLCVWLLGLGHVPFTWAFIGLYMAAAILLGWMVLFLAKWMTLQLWKRGFDPDNYVLPYLTSAIDVLGTGLLCFVFFALERMNYISVE
ncbi:uncharacterized protein VTP21DRAFT_3104 [Calcarisporiella thermophila]|uniref:uncharacterized protein n=1 Tax=Calcarisporiella thermophila TaxID=911321 RepID=UPI003744A8FC